MKTDNKQRAKHLVFSLFFCLFAFSLLPLAFCHADDEVTRIQKAYEHIEDIKGNFIQKSYIKDLKKTDTYKGQFFIKSPKMRWEYKGDKPQIVYITGDDIIIYQKKEKQAFKAKFDRATYGQAPIALLGGFGNIRNEFDVSIKTEHRLILKPKKPMGNIVSVEITTSSEEFPIESITIIDTLSNRIDIYLKDVKINTELKDKLFDFSPPEGVNVLQQ
jgi:outer membrane lipoprotein carrier protein